MIAQAIIDQVTQPHVTWALKELGKPLRRLSTAGRQCQRGEGRPVICWGAFWIGIGRDRLKKNGARGLA